MKKALSDIHSPTCKEEKVHFIIFDFTMRETGRRVGERILLFSPSPLLKVIALRGRGGGGVNGVAGGRGVEKWIPDFPETEKMKNFFPESVYVLWQKWLFGGNKNNGTPLFDCLSLWPYPLLKPH